MMKISHEIIGAFFIIQVTIFSHATAAELGSSCFEDSDCHVENSRCYQKSCSCLPFYAAYNSTVCLQSNMLGFECLIPEQCSKKVANSTCIGGICRCEPGFLQFRRHTCLTAAKIGEVCYNDMHCRLSDSGSHCDFMIANLFGRCVCNAPLKLSRAGGTCLPNAPPPSTSTAQSLDFPYPVITKTDVNRNPVEFFNKSIPATNKTPPHQSSSSSNTNNVKLQNAQKTPQKPNKPSSNNDYKLLMNGTATDQNKIKGNKPAPQSNTKPENKPKPETRPKPETKPPNKFDDKPPNKLTNSSSKPADHKPFKKPSDQKFSLNHFLNKTLLSGDESIFQSLLNAQKINRHTTTSRPEAFTTKLLASTSAKPHKQQSIASNFFVNLQHQQTSKPTRQSNKTESQRPHQNTNQMDKILVVSNTNNGHHKKPSKNKISSANKNTFKNPFQSNFAFLNNITSEDTTGSSNKLPSNTMNKHSENQVKNTSISKENTSNGSTAVLRPLHHRGAEDGSNIVISLGYTCKNDQQCMRNDNNSRCINGICDCVARRTKLENACSAKNRGCHKGTFQCKSTGVCISWFFVCDGRKDCADGSDENCRDKSTCPEHAFRCGTSTPAVCISQASRCDGANDCPNGEDEYNCTATKHRGCPLHTFQCEDGRCLPEYEFCNAVISCHDGSDEPDNSCTATWNTSVRNLDYCPFRCSNGRCRSSAVVCSGRDGCGDNSDENRCSVCKCPPPT
ncbi:uncharacterized protein LOC135831137 isoform X2 [Planococcus citri]|uniref:uncharacterized protein LOC135831137 isoform X2 n=1 Tax=Planococcus citri TaxID=170843 RepID=UPI0031F78F11